MLISYPLSCSISHCAHKALHRCRLPAHHRCQLAWRPTYIQVNLLLAHQVNLLLAQHQSLCCILKRLIILWPFIGHCVFKYLGRGDDCYPWRSVRRNASGAILLPSTVLSLGRLSGDPVTWLLSGRVFVPYTNLGLFAVIFSAMSFLCITLSAIHAFWCCKFEWHCICYFVLVDWTWRRGGSMDFPLPSPCKF